MHDLIYCPPKFIRRFFPAFQWECKTDKILLTFDDGPTTAVLGKIMDFLDDNKIKAAFFLVGENANKNPSLVKELLSAGHLIANHTQNHQDIILCTKQKIDREIDQCTNSLAAITNNIPLYFRPPHGRFDWRTAKIMQGKNLKCILWSLLTGDYTGNRQLACNNIKKHLVANSIVTLHDNLKSSETVIPVLKSIIDVANSKGYKIGSPSECLK